MNLVGVFRQFWCSRIPISRETVWHATVAVFHVKASLRTLTIAKEQHRVVMEARNNAGSSTGLVEENYSKEPSSPGKLRKVMPLQSLDGGRGSEPQELVLEEEFYLEGHGYVHALLGRDCLTWQMSDPDETVQTYCLGRRRDLESIRGQILTSEIYAVEKSGFGIPKQIRRCCSSGSQLPEMYRIAVHSFIRARRNKSCWIPTTYTFCHENAAICRSWVERMQQLLDRDLSRPKNLLVLVNPYGGKGAGVATWEKVAPLFARARVNTKVVITDRAQHAYDLISQTSDDEFKSLDGVVVVGGDGLFNEVLNGLVMHRHKAHPAPKPELVAELLDKGPNRIAKKEKASESSEGLRALSNMTPKANSGPGSFDVHSPLLDNLTDSALESRAVNYYSASSSPSASPSSEKRVGTRRDTVASDPKELELTDRDSFITFDAVKLSEAEPLRTGQDSASVSTIQDSASVSTGQGHSFVGIGDDVDMESVNSSRPKSNVPLRIGLIPAGSTDTVVISTTGSRNPDTAALHILLGDNMLLDIVKITGWKKSPESGDEAPRVRYAASFAGYGFYGDVMRESENARWLGPARYDVAGVKVFLKHKAYKAEVCFLDLPQHNATSKARLDVKQSQKRQTWSTICRSNCATCAKGMDLNHLVDETSEGEEGDTMDESELVKPRWRKLTGSFHSVGGAVMSCRNDKAPDGLVAHAHLADGLLHLILIRTCSRPSYLRQLITLTRKGADPLDFNFVEHYKTPVFTFTSVGEESIWNIDGELFPAHQLTAQVCRGLVSIFARGPEH